MKKNPCILLPLGAAVLAGFGFISSLTAQSTYTQSSGTITQSGKTYNSTTDDESAVKVTGGKYTSNGSNSAALYSTGTITCTDATLVANGAEALVIEGSNTIVLSNCTVQGNYDKWGAMLYQSMSGDASGVDGYLTLNGGSFMYAGTSYINGTISDPGISGTSVSNLTGNGNNIYYSTDNNPSFWSFYPRCPMWNSPSRT